MSHRALSSLSVVALVAAALVMPVAAAAAQSSNAGVAGVEVERYGGADRYETSLRIAEAFVKDAGGTVAYVVLVSGRHWTDAVIAASAASQLGAPLLLTPPEQLRDDALAFLERVGAERVLVVTSGEWPNTNVQSQVFAQIREAGFEDLWGDGADHYKLGVGAARALGQPGSLSSAGRSAIIANGEVFADALVAGPLSYKAQVPVLLTPPGELHPEVADYLREAEIAHVLLMGGAAALSENVEAAIRALGITNVDRMAGATRFETATMTARYAADRFASDSDAAGCFGGSSVGLARARIPFDSLGAAPLLAQRCAPLVLTDPAAVPPSTVEFLDAVRSDADRRVDLTVFGGDAAVSQRALDAYFGTEADETAPDLSSIEGLLAQAATQRAKIVSELTAKINAGAYGVDDDNALHGPAGFRIDLNDCPADWSDTAGITDSEIRIGYSAPLSGVNAQYRHVSPGMENYFDWVNANDPVAGRQITLVTKDDAFEASQTVDNVNNLIDAENVFSISTLGAQNSLAAYDRINHACVPHPFVQSGHPAWGDPVVRPWTTGSLLAWNSEAIIWGQWIKKNLRGELPVKVAGLVWGTEFGGSFEGAFAAWADANPDVISEFVAVRHHPAETSAEDLADEMQQLADTRPDVFISMTGSTACTSAIQLAGANGLASSVRAKNGALFTPAVCRDIDAFMKPAGSAADGWWVVGGGIKDTTDPALADDPFIDFARTNLDNAGLDVDEVLPGLLGGGYGFGYPYVEALRVAAELPGGLTRTNFMLAVRALDITHPLLLDGISYRLDGAADAYSVEGSDILQYDADGQTWGAPTEIIDVDGQTPNCVWATSGLQDVENNCGSATRQRLTTIAVHGAADANDSTQAWAIVHRADRDAPQSRLRPGYWKATADSYCLFWDSEAEDWRQGDALGSGWARLNGEGFEFDQSTRIRVEHGDWLQVETWSGDNFGAQSCELQWVADLD